MLGQDTESSCKDGSAVYRSDRCRRPRRVTAADVRRPRQRLFRAPCYLLPDGNTSLPLSDTPGKPAHSRGARRSLEGVARFAPSPRRVEYSADPGTFWGVERVSWAALRRARTGVSLRSITGGSGSRRTVERPFPSVFVPRRTRIFECRRADYNQAGVGSSGGRQGGIGAVARLDRTASWIFLHQNALTDDLTDCSGIRRIWVARSGGATLLPDHVRAHERSGRPGLRTDRVRSLRMLLDTPIRSTSARLVARADSLIEAGTETRAPPHGRAGRTHHHDSIRGSGRGLFLDRAAVLVHPHAVISSPSGEGRDDLPGRPRIAYSSNESVCQRGLRAYVSAEPAQWQISSSGSMQQCSARPRASYSTHQNPPRGEKTKNPKNPKRKEKHPKPPPPKKKKKKKREKRTKEDTQDTREAPQGRKETQKQNPKEGSKKKKANGGRGEGADKEEGKQKKKRREGEGGKEKKKGERKEKGEKKRNREKKKKRK